MNRNIPPEWAAMFKDKTGDELIALKPPPGLSEDDEVRFRIATGYAALQRKANGLDREEAPPPQKTRDEEIPPVSERRPKNPLPPLTIPEGSTDVLLDRQIATCVGLIDHLAHYVARYDTDHYNCNNFMERIVSMMNSSANVAKMVGRLRGSLQPDEKQLRQIIQREDRPGERPPSPR